MKTLFILLFTATCYISLAQDKSYRYSFDVDTLIDTENKSFLSDFTNQLNFHSRHVKNQYSFEIISSEDYSQVQFSQIASSLGANLISFDKKLVTYQYQATEKNGGQDCPDAAMVCNNNSFSGNASGYGTQELNGGNSGCLSSENQSSWYYINVDTPGTLEMTISPDDANDDYDFAIWGPFTSATAAANCPPSSSPIRCSWSADDGDTGMGDYWGCISWHWFWGYCTGSGWITPTDNSEGSGGDKWVAPLNVNSGEVYILLIDNYSTSTQPFDLSWGGTAGLDCTTVPLPVELIDFTVSSHNTYNSIEWSTASERNNDYFIVEHSTDGNIWNHIGEVNGAGNTNSKQNYSIIDLDFPSKINYYRLKQVDYDGTINKHQTISIDNSLTKKIEKRVNMMGQEVNENFKGIVILYYSDGSITKILQ